MCLSPSARSRRVIWGLRQTRDNRISRDSSTAAQHESIRGGVLRSIPITPANVQPVLRCQSIRDREYASARMSHGVHHGPAVCWHRACELASAPYRCRVMAAANEAPHFHSAACRCGAGVGEALRPVCRGGIGGTIAPERARSRGSPSSSTPTPSVRRSTPRATRTR